MRYSAEVFERLGSLPRRLRWALHKWNPAADREFHDALFKVQRYDPFSFAYPGYITIRRFAELTEPHLAGVRTAVDLGCGPGEITCELARRNPGIAFVGVDHSDAAITRAREHQASLALTNIDFRTADVSTFTPESADIVLMYDSFHHLLDPRGFVERLTPLVPRFVLIEPAGDWLGGWQKTLEFDWIPAAVDNIRARLAWQMNETAAEPPHLPPADERGEPVEHRYTLTDLKQFFDGYGLDVRGTIAGIGDYPPNPYASLPLRDEFGKIAADTMTAIEEVLLRHNLDLHAQHWMIHAERGTPHRLRTPRAIDPQDGFPGRSPGPYDVEYINCDGPTSVATGSTFALALSLKNCGWRPWDSDNAVAAVHVSYHWLQPDRTVAVSDGRRTSLPKAVAPGESLTLTVNVDTPGQAGRYILSVDLVEEGVTWFSEAGAPMCEQRINVQP